jgi:hypothetical protein
MAKDSVTAHKNGQCHHYNCVGKWVRHVGKAAYCTSCNKFAYQVSPGKRKKKEFCPKYRVYKGKCPCCEKP